MFQHRLTYVLMGVGILSLLFALGRTYWLIGRAKRERDRPRRRISPVDPMPDADDKIQREG